ncbi:ABC transporter ATP-binding protein [Vagococcus acidifermentans]|uniref:Multidrug ABC transporter ATP-binding protein n=1 Tax=Vagococcus acidifermentans TaxID=564710 RepID=A0A430AS49_9ENTE|nr:ABC transporter ATP-binding protein [Vagococcus acidifermentans]RSU10876.1 multidrug ABC transporter ATP-binding protein [Vagococcus acidifermentans]
MIKNLKYLRKKDWITLIFVVALILLQVQLDLTIPEYMSKITMLVQTPGSKVSQITSTGGKMLLISLGSVASSVIVGYLAAKLAASLGRELRFAIFNKVQDFSMEEINRFSTPSLITRSTNDIAQVQLFIAVGLQVLIKSPILAIVAIDKIAGKSWQWSALVGGGIIFLLVVILLIVFIAIPKFKKVQELTDDINRITRESLTGIKVVRAYNAEDYQEEKFEKASANLAQNNLFATRVLSFLQPSLNFAMSSISLGIYWLGAIIINNAAAENQLTIFSDMVVFSSYALQIIAAFMLMSILFMLLPRASVSAKRVNEVLYTKPTILDGAITDENLETKGKIQVKNVSFRYPEAEEYVLKDISFTAEPGETVAFIGSTGSGKSTLINLIPRFYDVSEGEILIDNVNVKDYNMEALNNKIGYVPQRAVLFSGSISSNVNFGNNGKDEISNSDIYTALEVAQGKEFVEKLPDGIDSFVAQLGTNLSGGQKQRVSIARAVARNPEILIFDDSFSALDYKTDSLVRQGLKKHTSGTTTLIVAQRVGTIMDADKIIVLNEGKVAGIGTHKELLKSCNIYYEIAKSQLTEEELDIETR